METIGENIREKFIEYGLENSIIFENPSYETAIIGYDVISNRIIYDYDKMIDYLVEHDNMTPDDAMDFISYNTLRTLPYIKNGPIIIGLFV